jgi:hypothetical protein
MAQKYNKTAGKKEVKRGYKKKLITPQFIWMRDKDSNLD